MTVQGFRGIGSAATLELQPGPGLTVVTGRNGCGKSSFAEAIEVALTGNTRRWDDAQGRDWLTGWRNLHSASPTAVSVRLLAEGADPAQVEVRHVWGDEAGLREGSATAQWRGRPREPREVLGWDAAMKKYRPFLSYSELGTVLSGKPSEFHDALASILGLDDIARAQKRLAERERTLRDAEQAVRRRRDSLAQAAAQVDDERAHEAHALLSAGRRAVLPAPETLAALDSLVTGVADTDESQNSRLRALLRHVTPSEEQFLSVAEELSEACERAASFEGTDAEQSGQVADLLDRALSHFRSHGPERCPVCGSGQLDAAWALHAEARVTMLRDRAAEAVEAKERLRAAEAAAHSLPTTFSAVLSAAEGLGLGTLDAAVACQQELTSAPSEVSALPGHLLDAGPALCTALGALRTEVEAELQRREDLWRPLALDIAAWLSEANTAVAVSERTSDLKQALAWLKGASTALHNERLAPLAKESARLWEMLRQESNITLGDVALAGSNTSRHVKVDVAVDGSDGSALGVMSQGEIHALGLSLFLPRATVEGSPFRFVVIDDPVQAMDPAKVDGLARVLVDIARKRQVLVFTHDDRLPAALRDLRLPARIVEVVRDPFSRVAIVETHSPAAAHLADAWAVIKDRDVPAEVIAKVVPGLCRLAVEAACIEKIRRDLLGRGATHVEVEDAIAQASSLMARLRLALFGDSENEARVVPWLRDQSADQADAIQACNSGAHGTLPRRWKGDVDGLVRATAQMISNHLSS